jgi:hypothetical protein
VRGLHLIGSNIEAARDKLISRGVEISEPFHDAGGVFHHAGGKSIVSGPNPQRQSFASYASFSDPDGNGWVFQEVTAHLSGHIEAGDPRFTSQLLNAIGIAAAVFYPGGHGPMWDLAEDKNSIKLLESFLAAGKTLVEGKNVTGFTDGEEADVELTKVVPFLVEDEMIRLGAIFSRVKNWGVHTVADGQLITGQNPASSGPAARLLIETLKENRKKPSSV